MKRHTLLICGVLYGAVLTAQPSLLTLDDALRLALDQNHTVEQAQLSLSGKDDALTAARTQRLPAFKVSTTTGMLLSRPTITFDKGVFGNYAGFGPIPSDRSEITSARKPASIVSAEVSQPLTHLRRISLGIRLLELSKAIAQEQVRLTRQETAKRVRQTYYAILQHQSSLDAVEHTLALLRELETQTGQYVRVGTAINGDLLQVRARLAQAEYDRVALIGPLDNAKEQLNQLMGRPLDTPFRVEAAVEASWVPELDAVRKSALSARPEIQQARLQLQSAEVDKRKKASEYIPDVSLALTYYSAFNVSTSLPRNVAIAGVQVSWEPFDWGRKKRELAQKDKSIAEARLNVRDVEDKTALEVGAAYRKVQESRVLLAASRKVQESARETARLATVRYRVESALLKDVLNAESDLASANDRTQKALLAYWSARADLERAMGGEQ